MDEKINTENPPCETENSQEENNPDMNQNNDAELKEKTSTCSTTNHCAIKIVAYAILLLGVIGIYILHFTGKSNTDNFANKISSSENSIMLTVNNDSIIKHFTLAEILKNDLETEAKKYQQDLATKKASFEEKYKNYQINVQNNVLTQTQIQNAERQLQQEAEVLQGLQEQYSQTLGLKEMSVQREITDSIINAARRVNDKKFKADYVLATSTGSAVLYANKEYDITKYVIEELNNAYKKSSQ